MDPSVCSRKRAVLQLHQEAKCPPPAWKRRRREEEEEEEMKRRTGGGCKENRDPGDLDSNLKREHRRLSSSGSRTRTSAGTGSEAGFRSGGKVRFCRADVKVAQIRKTRTQTSVRTGKPRGSEWGPGFILPDQTNPGSTETQTDQRRWTRTAESWSEARSRSTAGPSSETRTSSSERVLGPSRTRSESKTRTRRRRKIQPSVFQGRGRLRLSISAEAGQLVVHIHEARGLMGESPSSYVKLAVTSDLSIRMKTPTVLNNKNPEYNHKFTLCVSDDVVPNRLLVSVFSSCRQLIGCMSFGIGSSQLISGWFYLLGEEFGRSKHLRVTSQRNKPMRSPEDGPVRCELRSTPDPAPETNVNRTAAPLNHSAALNRSTTGPRDRTSPGLTLSRTNTKTSSFGVGPASSVHSRCVSTQKADSTQRQVTRDSGNTRRLTVSIDRGNDGFGFTICSDCPVRVQAVDAGGPAHQSGLRQGDSVLQLNGLPVETWKCVDLAHAIRSSLSQIVLVVWRGLPELRPTHSQTTGRKLLPPPAHSKHGRRRGQGSGVRSSFGALGSLWRDRKEEQEQEEEEEEYPPRSTTLTRVTSSQGDNYIILSPVNPRGQLLQTVYHDRNATIGRLYQTHPRRGQNLLHDPPPESSQRPFPGCPPLPSASSSSAPPCNYGNYQNCTIVQSHLPCSAYGSYVTLPPKTLIFPVFVQPLDLCSPDRTLLMSEEMVLHQADLLPAKVTVLIYSDLLLFTREDEAGRCNVLQSPLYLNTLQLREVSSEPLQIYFLQSSQMCWRCLFSLEAFSFEQKVRVRLCLHDNIQLQLVATDTRHSHQPSDLPSDFGLLSLAQSDLLYRPSSPYSSDPPLLPPSSLSPYSPGSPFSSLSPHTSSSSSSPPSRTVPPQPPLLPQHPLPCPPLRSPVWKERGGGAEEERQQGEGESASETSENVGGGVRGRVLLHFNMKEEEEEDSDGDEEEEEFSSSYRPEALRRSLSEGSLLQEPRSPRFLSDSTIHQLTRPATSDLDLGTGPAPWRPSVDTLRKQLTREGGSLHHMLLLLNGTKDTEFRNLRLRKKTKSLAADVRSRLLFLRRPKNSSGVHGNSLEKALRNNRPSTREVLRWAESLEALLTNQYGLAVFRHFLRSEFSEENLDFWLAAETFKRTRPLSKMAARAAKIYDEFISTNAARQVNVDSSVRESTKQALRLGVNVASFQLAQDQIFSLMESDSYPRFLRSRLYAQLANQGSQTATQSANQSAAVSVAVGQS
ncbi:regulator of G-protein signaling 3-like isoform X2 [Sander lucioperca]|uniref:regulator of G-protein signaling 3-like isoform X2 n=1 Tax=Sander lucioperca TaxID=283035 RepID=UPI001653D2F2|nr:regulator of G-protein signaling 3-like isoform X2 [Sander lucioperca]